MSSSELDSIAPQVDLLAIAAHRDTAQPEYAITETVPPYKYQALVASASELWRSDRAMPRR